MELSGPAKLWLLMWVFTSLNPIGHVMSGKQMSNPRPHPIHSSSPGHMMPKPIPMHSSSPGHKMPKPMPMPKAPPPNPEKSKDHPKLHGSKEKDKGPFRPGHSMPKPMPMPKSPSSPEKSKDHPKFHGGNQKDKGPFRTVSMRPKPKPAPIPQFTNHNGQVCSTWGNNRFTTFDGDAYYFPGTCEYVFASHCKGSSEDFNILFRRTEENGVPYISHMLLKIHEAVIEITNGSLTLDGDPVTEIPVAKSRVLIDRCGNNLKISYSSDIYFVWNKKDSMLIKLNRNKYGNQTCGMCGDFNGIRGLTFDGIEVTAEQFGNMQKQNEPTEHCPDVYPSTPTECIDKDEICKSILTSEAFSNCNIHLDPKVYIDMCVQELCKCNSKDQMSCLCSMFAEYSRQCTHAGGVPGNWRTPSLCPVTCPSNMVYKEYGSPCPNTCSNTERSLVCEDHNTDGCFCPEDTMLDDINNTGCIPQEECFCVYDATNYSPGLSYSTTCQSCTCTSGKWDCNSLPCTSSCAVEGGSHFTTFDGSRYSVNGDCSYVLAKHSTGHDFVLLGELRRCSISSIKSCLKGLVLVLNGGENVVSVKENGVALLNWMTLQPPVSVANMTISQPSSFYTNIKTSFGLSVVIQLVPSMQVYIDIDSAYKQQTCGLCGNFNNEQADDFTALSGIIEGTAAGFINTWKTLANCPNIKNSYEDPCSLNVEKEKYAMHWCGLLTSATGPFSPCHSLENPLTYHVNCMSDTCSGTDSEAFMCAALSSYAFTCARKGVLLSGWRDHVCQKYKDTCKESQVYYYHDYQFQPTCRSLSEADPTRNTKLVPVDGCVCRDGTYLNDNGDCVEASACPCYYQGNVIQSGEMIEENGFVCTCDKGKLNCMGSVIKTPVCIHPLIYLNCSTAPMGSKGVECQKSCDTLDMDCYSSQCISGCICDKGLVSDGNGGCIQENQCPCIHNEAAYKPGSTISVSCNTCTCKNRKWQCTHKQCLGSCTVYGNGHHTSFDNKQFTFSGNCEYTLIQDNRGDENSFRVIVQNVDCGFNGTICSKTIKVFHRGMELRLDNEKIETVKREESNTVPYNVFQRGSYLIIEIDKVYIMWDRKATMQIKLSSDFKGNLGGICGNYDGNAKNDFTTRSFSVVENLMEFYNSWKIDPMCPDVHDVANPCSLNPYRKAWASKQCAILISDVFKPCHSQVDPTMYQDSCIRDSCSCDSGGDCECFCTAVAAYAQACSENGICIKWRTPTICPMFCDYYNEDGECAWHYKPCGDKCMKTCRNPKGECLHELSGLEGCYPKCPATKPYLNEDIMKCVSQCGCYDPSGLFYNYGDAVPSEENCYSCECSMEGISCQYDVTACRCEHEEIMYRFSEIIPSMNDTDGLCKRMICDVNGTILTLTNLCTTAVTATTPTKGNLDMLTTTYTNLPLSTTPVTSEYVITQTSSSTPSIPTHSVSEPIDWSTSSSNPSTSSTPLTTSTEPTTSIPTTLTEPTTSIPTTEPTTSIPTTLTEPTTSFPTTSTEPTTSIPTILTEPTSIPTTLTEPTTSIPTTSTEPTTSIPTTSTEPITSIPTTSTEPTTSIPKTSTEPTTSNPTSTFFTSTTKITSTASTVTESLSSTPRTPHNPFVNEPNTSIPSTSFTSTTKTTSTAFTVTEPFSSSSTFPTSSPKLSSPSTPLETSTEPTTSSPTLLPSASSLLPNLSSTLSYPVSSSKPSTTSTPLTTLTEPTTSSSLIESTPSTPSNPLTTTMEPTTSSSLTESTPLSTTSCSYCFWTRWYNENRPTSKLNSGDYENMEIVKAKGISECSNTSYVQHVECKSSSYGGIKFEDLGQNAKCSVETGLICKNSENTGPFKMCYDYEMRFYCCEQDKCLYPTTTTAIPTPTSTPQTTTGYGSSSSGAVPFGVHTTSVTTNRATKSSFSTTLIPTSTSTTVTTNITSTASTVTEPFSSTPTFPISSSKTSPVQKIASSPTIPTFVGDTSTNQDGFCVYEDSVYKVGSYVPQPPGSCKTCECTATMKNTAEITCIESQCFRDCQMGYSYKEVPGQCCGTCVQEYCVLNNTVPIKPGYPWYPPGDKCTSYSCEPETFMVVKSVMSCPHQKPINCDQGILVNFTSMDGCCTIQLCEPRKCDVMKSWKLIESGGCVANITLTNCGGYCSSVSRDPNFPKMKKHDCTCCQAAKTNIKNLQLDCNNGRNIGYTYTEIEQCICRGAICEFTE